LKRATCFFEKESNSLERDLSSPPTSFPQPILARHFEGMGAIEAHVNASKPTNTLKSSTGLHLHKVSSGGSAKPPRVVHTYPPRVIHTYSPRVYKIQPEEFLELVQKLTGKAVARPKPPRTFQFFETDAAKAIPNKPDSNPQVDAGLANEFANVQDTPRTILGALPSPRLVTLNFLPLLSATPRAGTESAEL